MILAHRDLLAFVGAAGKRLHHGHLGHAAQPVLVINHQLGAVPVAPGVLRGNDFNQPAQVIGHQPLRGKILVKIADHKPDVKPEIRPHKEQKPVKIRQHRKVGINHRQKRKRCAHADGFLRLLVLAGAELFLLVLISQHKRAVLNRHVGKHKRTAVHAGELFGRILRMG